MAAHQTGRARSVFVYADCAIAQRMAAHRERGPPFLGCIQSLNFKPIWMAMKLPC